MGLPSRFITAWRRVGFLGLVSDLRWRVRTALGGRSIAAIPMQTARIVRRDGVTAVARRTRYGMRQLRRPADGSLPAEEPPHPWTQSVGHMVAFSPYFDLTAEDLATNSAIIGRFDGRTPNVETATWFLPFFHHVLFGGIHTIFRIMDYMTREHGVQHRLVILDSPENDRKLRARISGTFPSLSTVDIVLVDGGAVPYDELPHTDIGICTLWTTAFALARFDNVGAKFYMVQDFEPVFYQAGTIYGLTEATYRLGFAGIVNTPGLGDIYASYGNSAMSFTPSFSVPDAIPPKPSEEPNAPVQIVLYGRPTVDRNAFELVASACVQLKRRYGKGIRIVSAGEEFDSGDLGLDGVLENQGLLSTLEDVQDLYLESDIGICFMFSRHPSYQPFEYLAAGVAPVANVNADTSWFLKDGENCLVVDPYPSAIAAAVGRLVDDPDLRKSIAARGRDEVAAGNWKRELDSVWEFVTGTGP